MDIKIQKLTPELVEDYVQFFDKTPHWDNDETKCYCITWCSDNIYLNGGKHWFSSSVERKNNAIQRVRNGDIHGYLAYFNNEVIGWCNANTKSGCKESINYLRTEGGVPLELCKDGEKIKNPSSKLLGIKDFYEKASGILGNKSPAPPVVPLQGAGY